MKKTFLGLLMVVLIVVAGFGGFYIGKSVSSDKTTVTKNALLSVIDDFTKGAGWTQEEKSFTTQTSSNTQNYEDSKINYNGQEDLIKAFVFFTKYALLNENVKENTFYFSEASYSMNTFNYTGSMGLYYEFAKSCAFINLYDFSSETQVLLIIDMQPVENNTYVLNILTDKSMVNQNYQAGFTLQQLYLDQYATEIYSYSRLTVQTPALKLNDITINDVDEIHLFGCDIRTNQLINIYKDEIASEDSYTFEALLDVYTEQASRYDGVNFVSREYEEIDALKLVYEDLGYNVVE